ncbi:MAG: 30S ribosomal protein S15 [Candidatus Marinimicrobia bacterium CG08_land_8_20_14_0_20_45_22]|nr:MAG: 30S ribosomal protein S15 [Candidatus Marinimicrobia bacterium CG08_land_8_20_14_0_20_45_22]
MVLTKDIKQELVEKYGQDPKNTGSAESQIAILTQRIKELTEHFLNNPKDHASRRGLMKLVSRRKHLLSYLKKKNMDSYRTLIADLNIRK